MRTIAVANQKGGCGKTTTSVNLATAFAMMGKKTVIVDLDPQAHATLGLGYTPEHLDHTIYDVITAAKYPVEQTIKDTNVDGLNLIPSNILLSGAEAELMGNLYWREFILQQRLGSLNGTFDICVIDCSPSLSMITVNALVASTDVIVPVQTHYYALEGLRQLLETIDIVKTRYNQDLKILGILLTFMETRTLLCQEVQKQMKEYFGELLFDTVIHRNIRLAEAPSAGESVMTYDKKCKGAIEYMALAQEIYNEA